MIYSKTYLVENPNAPWVTFIHGAGGSSNIWFKQLRAFVGKYNVLLVDLRGHGNSADSENNARKIYSFDEIAQEVMVVLDHHQIKSSFFVGISLGSILARLIAETHPNRVDGLILGGAIIRLNFKSRFLVGFGNLTKSILPYLWLYKMLAVIIMPKKNHRESRILFVNEAKKLCQKEFLRWFKLTYELMPITKLIRSKEINIPTLYIMGEEDHLFLRPVKELVRMHQSSQLHIIPNCGHVVNVEQPDIFNEKALGFIRRWTKV